MEWDGMCGNEVEKQPFYGKIHGSQTTTRNNGIKTTRKSKSSEKKKTSQEMKTPRSMATTMDRPWLALAQYSSVLSFFHEHSNLGVPVVCHNTLI